MADLSTESINALNLIFGALTRSGSKLRDEIDDINTVAAKKSKLDKADQILAEKITKSNQIYSEKIKQLNDSLSGTDKKMSIFAASIKMANDSFKDLVDSNDVTAEYLQNTFPKKLASSLSTFMSQTGLVVKDFRDVMRLQDIGDETKRMIGVLAEGNKNQYESSRAYLKLVKDSGMSFEKLTGMSGVAVRRLELLSRVAENSAASEKRREYARVQVTKIVNDNITKLGSVAEVTATAMGTLAEREKSQSAMAGETQRAVSGKIKQIGIDLAKSVGKKAITEMMDMAREGMQRGVEPFPKIAGQMYLSGKQYQEVMADNIRAVNSSVGGYDEFNKLMVDHNNEYLKITGMDPVLAAKAQGQSITMLKTFSMASMSADEVSTGMTSVAKGAERFRNVTGQTTEAFIAMNQRIADNFEVQNSMVSLGKTERVAMGLSISARVTEYQKMGLAADKAEKLATWLQKSSGMKSPMDIMRETQKVQLQLIRSGMSRQDAARWAQLEREKEAGVNHTEAQVKELDNLTKKGGEAINESFKKQGNMSLAGALVESGLKNKLLGQGGESAEGMKSSVELARANGLAAEGEPKGPGTGTVMDLGGMALTVTNEFTGLKNNIIANWALWGGAIVGAIALQRRAGLLAEKGVTKALEKFGPKAGEKMSQTVGRTLGTAAADIKVAAKGMSWARAGELGMKGLKGLKGGVAGLGLLAAQSVADEKSTTGKVLNSNTVNGAAFGATLGSVVPVVGTAAGALAGGAIGGAMDLYDYIKSPSTPTAAPTSKHNPSAPTKTPAVIAAEDLAASQETTNGRQEKVVNINEQSLDAARQTNAKLDKVAKLMEDSNNLYAMTEEQKKAFRQKTSYIARS